MSLLNFKLTVVGLAAASAASTAGAEVNLTHMSLGAGQYAVAVNGDGNATQITMVSRRETTTFSGGARPSLLQILLAATFPVYIGTPYNAGEIGLWIGDPDAGGILFGIYSAVGYVHAYRNDQLQLTESYGFSLGQVPEGSVNIVVDPTAANAAYVRKDANGSDFANIEQARENLGVFSKEETLEKMTHVGFIVMTKSLTFNPAVHYGGGTWSLTLAGLVPVGQLADDPDFGVVGHTGGEKKVALEGANNGPHVHGARVWNANDVNGNVDGFGQPAADTGLAGEPVGPNEVREKNNANQPIIASSGEGTPHNNLQPFGVVRFWERTA